MNYWHDIPSGEDTPNLINVLVEIPKGSQNKYEIDKDHGVIKLDRVLFSSIHYPGDYGLIPQTLGEDSDPLDALVLVTYPTYPGILISARPIAVLHMIDNGEGDDKILCVPNDDVRARNILDVTNMHKPVLDEIAHFFEVYKQLEGKKVEIGDWNDAAAAKKIIEESVTRYNEEFKK